MRCFSLLPHPPFPSYPFPLALPRSPSPPRSSASLSVTAISAFNGYVARKFHPLILQAGRRETANSEREAARSKAFRSGIDDDDDDCSVVTNLDLKDVHFTEASGRGVQLEPEDHEHSLYRWIKRRKKRERKQKEEKDVALGAYTTVVRSDVKNPFHTMGSATIRPFGRVVAGCCWWRSWYEPSGRPGAPISERPFDAVAILYCCGCPRTHT